jgi:hypothetical protein
MVLRSSRGRPFNAPAAFIHPCQPVVAKQPPSGPGWKKAAVAYLQLRIEFVQEAKPYRRV